MTQPTSKISDKTGKLLKGYRIILKEQLAKGYFEKIDDVIYHRDYIRIGKDQDGNPIVLDPNNRKE